MNAPMPPSAVTVASLPINQIVASPSNPRKHFDEGYLAELAETIKAHGVLQPITVRPNPIDTNGIWPYELVVGECRWRASKLAGLTDIPAFWRELDDKQVLEIQVIENLQRRDVHPLEEAEGYDMLMKRHGYLAEQIADKIGKSKGYVYARLKLIALCRIARDAFYDGKLDASTALLIARIPDEKQQVKATKEITEPQYGEPLSYRQAKQRIRTGFTLSLKQATFPIGDANLVFEAGACTTCPKRSGNNPDLFGDIDDEDVCTDTRCFENKKLARREQIIEQAGANKIPVLTGDEAKEVMPRGIHSINPEQYIALDRHIEDDADHRTYREVLGDTVPVALLIEQPWGDKNLIEVAEPKAIEKALRKAGWTPTVKEQDDDGNTTVRKVTPEEIKAQEESDAKAKRDRLIEHAWRQRLISESVQTLRQLEPDAEDTHRLILVFAQRFFFLECDYGGIPAELMKRHGHTFPEPFDEGEEIDKFLAAMDTWTTAQALAYLFDCLIDTNQESRLSDALPVTTLALANLVGVSSDAIRAQVTAELDAPADTPAPKKAKAKKSPPIATAESASTPTKAAQARGESGAEDQDRPDVRYAMWGASGWQTWSGRGKKPAWVENWLANGKTLEDLEAKADPAQATPASGNETPPGDQPAADDETELDPAPASPAEGTQTPPTTAPWPFSGSGDHEDEDEEQEA